MARLEPRRPDWLALTPPMGGPTAAPQPGQQRDETVRALVFPATTSRPATAAAAGTAPQRPARAPASLLKSAAPAPPGSTLGAEPAYRSALDRLLQRPATAPGTASAARAGGGAGSTAPALPSSRLDSLLAAGRPASTGQQQPQQQGQQGRGASLDSLLRRTPGAAAAAACQRAPLPSSRLDELLARPASAASSSLRVPPAGYSSRAAAARPATAAGGSTSLRLAGPVAAGHGTATPPARAAALSPVDEERSPASGVRQFPRSSAAVGSAGPGSAGGGDQPAAGAAGQHAGARQAAGPGAAAVAAVPPAAAPAAPSAAVAGAAVEALDPGLHDRLRERIEQAKAHMRQQLSPMFRLSDALLGAGQDPGRAAQALDAATGLAASGFDQLAARPGSRGGGSGAPSSRPAGQQVDGSAAGPAAALPPSGGGSLPRRERPQYGTQGQPSQEKKQGLGAWDDAGAPGLHPAFVAGASSAEEVDSLVANARAAAARAQSAIAGLTSPPRLHTGTASGVAGTVGSTPSDSSAPRPVAPLPYAQQRQDERPVAELQLAAHGGSRSSQLALPAGDAQAMVALLREQSEALIRSECERLVAGMHAVLDSLLDRLQQAQQQQAAQQAQQQQAQQAAQQQAAQQQEQVELDEEERQPSEAAQPAGTAGSRDGSEAGNESAASGSLAIAERHGEAQPAWELHQQQADEPQQQPNADAGGPERSSAGELFAFAAAAPQQWGQQWGQQWEQQQRTPSAGSPPEPPNPGGLAGAGFGSPFKLPSQHPSPAKRQSAGKAEGLPAPSWAVHQRQQQQQQQQQRQLPDVTAKSLSFAPFLPAAAAGTPASQATPALLPVGGGVDAYRTARSVASVGPLSSPGGSVASSGGGGGEVAATPGYYSSWSGGGAVGAAGGKDMDHILGSIRRLAAEMRMKQGVLAVPPSTAAPAAAASASKPPR